jgi:hypothetical protein
VLTIQRPAAESREAASSTSFVEYPFAPPLPSLGDSRLYLAESVAAVIEVKSNVADQWSQAVHTEQLASLQRAWLAWMITGPEPDAHIPLFVVEYTGWAGADVVRQKLGQPKDCRRSRDRIGCICEQNRVCSSR